jgi:DNA-binding NtrC family response regulator
MTSRATRILLVDDEPSLLESMRAYLSSMGHTVASFRDGGSAWDCFAADETGFQVVIVDLTLDGMPGEEFIAKVLQRSPEIGVLATSGYSMSLLTLGLRSGRVGTLQKPFTPRMLTDALQRLLAGEAGASG